MSNVVPEGWRASTYLNSSIQTYADLAYRCKAHFGYPISIMELTDEQIANFIDDAVERFTQYAGYTEEYLVFTDNLYEPGCGVRLDQVGQVQCNLQQCVLTSEETYVSTVEITEEVLSIASGLLSVTPFNYIPVYDKCDPADIKVTSPSGQMIELRFDQTDPWDFATACQANCVRIYPRDTQCFELSTSLPDYVFNLEEYSEEGFFTTWLEILSGSEIPLSSYPLSSLPCEILESIPVSTYDLSSFYDADDLLGVETTACINIKDGKGHIYPKCNTADIEACDPLSAQWHNNPISMIDATHFRSQNIPICMGENIPLDSFDGILGTFTLCNTAINTFGAFPITDVQFLIDVKPSEDVLYSRWCDVQNGGFIIRKFVTDLDQCLNSTPDYVDVDIHFLKVTTAEITATRVVETSSFFDESLIARRKVHGVFSAEPGNEMGYGGFGGNNILFNFDYSLMSNIMGYDLRGNRHTFDKNGYDLTTYHAARSFIETTRKMLRYVTYTYNADTQLLKLIPEPRQSKFGNVYVENNSSLQCYMVGCYVEKPVEHILKEPWVRDYVIALMEISIGNIKSQYGQISLYGGATISGSEMLAHGYQRQEKLLDELRKENYYSAPPLAFMG